MSKFMPLAKSSALLPSISIEPSLKVASPSYCPIKRLFFSGLRIQKIVSTRLMYRNITAVKAIFLPVEKWALGIDENLWLRRACLKVYPKFKRLAAVYTEFEAFVLL